MLNLTTLVSLFDHHQSAYDIVNVVKFFNAARRAEKTPTAFVLECQDLKTLVDVETFCREIADSASLSNQQIIGLIETEAVSLRLTALQRIASLKL
jgi:hypothetical protein